jgi:hypothetical protein
MPTDSMDIPRFSFQLSSSTSPIYFASSIALEVTWEMRMPSTDIRLTAVWKAVRNSATYSFWMSSMVTISRSCGIASA